MKLHHIIGLLICLSILILPVSAAYTVTGGNIDLESTISQDNAVGFTYTANPDEKISVIEFDLPINTVVNFTLYYGSSSSVSGWAIYRVNTPLINSFSEVSLGAGSGGTTYQEIFIDPLITGYSTTKHIQFTSYARNDTTTVDESGFAIYAQGYGLYSGELAYFPVSDLPSNMIYRIDFTADQPISFTIDTARADVLARYVTSTVGEQRDAGLVGAVTGLYDFGMMVVGVVFSLLYWLKFIFVDNLVLTVVMYFAGTLAIAMNTSGNFFKRLERFFRYQVKLFNFVSTAFKVLLDMIVSVKSLIPFLK